MFSHVGTWPNIVKLKCYMEFILTFFSVFFSFLFFFSSQASSLSKEEHGKSESEDDFFEPWSSKRTGILAKYTTSEKLSITTVSYNAPYMYL